MPLTSPYTLNATHPIPARTGVAVPLLKSQSITIINTHGTQVIDFWCFAQPPPTSTTPNTFPLTHHLSLPHTRASLNRLSPLPNDTLTTNTRTPILTFLSDTSPGVHDTLIAACDIWRYRELSGNSVAQNPDYWHASCADNCRDALLQLAAAAQQQGDGSEKWTLEPSLLDKDGQRVDYTPPAPLNLWMNIPVHPKTTTTTLQDANTPAVAEARWKEGSGPSCGASLSFERPVCKAGDEVVMRAEMDCVVVMSACPQDLLEINCGVPRGCEFVVRGE